MKWIWVMLGLMAWMVLVVLWVTGPSHCMPPSEKTGKVACHWPKGGARR